MKSIFKITRGRVYLFCTALIIGFLLASFADSQKVEYNKNTIDLSDSLYWDFVNYKAMPSPQQIENGFYEKLKIGAKSLSKIVGQKGHYIWIKAEFEISEDLNGENLAFFASHIHFADDLWLNGSYIGGYGRTEPVEQSAQYVGHAYYFPKELLNKTGKNTILLRVWSHGKGAIAGKVFVGSYAYVKHVENLTTFFNSTIYMFFEGGMFATFILYLFLFMVRRKQQEYFWFSMLSLSTMIFSTCLYAPNVPWYTCVNLDFYKFYRTTMCLCGMINIYLLISFCRTQLNFKARRPIEILRFSLYLIQNIILYSVSDYDGLMYVCKPLFLLTGVHISLIVYLLVHGLIDKEKRPIAVRLVTCFTPFLISIVIDFIIRGGFQVVAAPFASFFGWQFTIISFLFLFSHQHATLLIQNETLNTNLQGEVEKQTDKLQIANSQLEDRIHRSEVDLKMASIVQQKFFPYPSKNYVGWDIAVAYEPLSEVSGDFYDYYSLGNTLDGFSLFDVSGHGIAASLITMLSKNIVYNAFQKNRFYDVPISKCLLDINHDLLAAKGQIENYMTGVLLRFAAFDENGECKIDLANAGHPHPILYSVKNDLCEELVGDVNIPQFGALGMKNMECNFRDVNFTMQKDDILVCFTDGVTEAQNDKKEQFGKYRLMKVIEANHEKDSHRLLQAIQKELADFTANVERQDDITIIILKREDSREFLEALDSE